MDGNELSEKSTESKQSAEILIDWTLANADAIEWARFYGHELLKGITESTIRQLQAEIAAFIESGDLTIPQLKKRLEPLFGAERAGLIASTEVTRAFAEGNITAWKKSGVTEGKEWVTANDELVCTICGPLDGQIVAIDAEFEGGYYAPPAHPRCRCGINPVPILDLA